MAGFRRQLLLWLLFTYGCARPFLQRTVIFAVILTFQSLATALEADVEDPSFYCCYLQAVADCLINTLCLPASISKKDEQIKNRQMKCKEKFDTMTG